ncbi:hypothetical protein QAD02_022050 [Eretmocerus hayati]|uniref:Uncharacterized protein n=1 Tax=Eretmocerus hayati TaxID=131215 RepID=A0ACC2PRV5_9HYME|nr:hypothetical protein QAD02_022050 [Eretmocerus hayati]
MDDLSQEFNHLGLHENKLFSDSVHICLKVLVQKSLIKVELSEDVLRNSVEIGSKMSQEFINFFENLVIEEDEDKLFGSDEEADADGDNEAAIGSLSDIASIQGNNEPISKSYKL